MGSATYTPSTTTRCGEDTSVQFRWCSPRLLQFNPIWSTNAYNIEAATHAKFIGSCRSTAATITRSTASMYWLPVLQQLHYKLGNPTYNTRATSSPDYLNSLISAHTWGTKMSLLSASPTHLAVSSTRTALASRVFNVCAPVV